MNFAAKHYQTFTLQPFLSCTDLQKYLQNSRLAKEKTRTREEKKNKTRKVKIQCLSSFHAPRAKWRQIETRKSQQQKKA